MHQRSKPPQSGDLEDLLGLDAASELLGVPVEQVRAMAAQGLITTYESTGGPGFQRAELLAVRDLGG